MQSHPKKLYVLVPDKPYQIQEESSNAAMMISSVIKTCLGPRAMQKMVITKINSIEITNDGNSILREIDVSHPSARSIIELSRTQDEEVGDGTTSVVILAAEILKEMSGVLSKGHHPIKVCKYLMKSLSVMNDVLDDMAMDLQNAEDSIIKIIKSSVETKLCGLLKVPIERIAYESVNAIYDKESNTVDIKNNLKIEKIFGSNMVHSVLLDGIILNKDIIHPQMRKRIVDPRVLILDVPLEYKKGESQTCYEFKSKDGFTRALEMEEKQVRQMCQYILNVKPDVVVSEKGICDLALSVLYQNNITGIRRVKKSDAVRLAKATAATIVNRLEDLDERHLGTQCGLFEYIKHGDEYYTQFSKCRKPKACSVIVRGPTRDIMNELERNFYDAVKIAKNLVMSPKLVPGGGCVEMNVLNRLREIECDGLEKEVYDRLCQAFLVIPSILLQNSGIFNPLMKLDELETKIVTLKYSGVDGVSGEICDMRDIILEPLIVKKQCYISALQAVVQLLRIDGIVESRK